MANPPETGGPTAELPGKRLRQRATKALPSFVEDLRTVLLAEAARISSGEIIDDDDLAVAYKRLGYPDPNSAQFADAQSVISQALAENHFAEKVAYVMAAVLFAFGLVLLSVGVVSADTGTRIGAFIGGSLIELLILLPFRFAVNLRRHNIALRMLGLILDRVQDPKKVAPLLKDTFLAVVLGEARFTAGRRNDA